MRQLKQQKIYEAVLLIFRKHNFHSFSLINYQKLKGILNQQAYSIIGQDFQEKIIDDIWQKCEEKGQRGIQIITIAQTFVQAITILRKRIQLLQGQFGLIADRKRILNEKKYELSLYQEQSQIGNKHIFQLEQTIQKIQTQISQFEEDYENFHKQIKLIQTILLGDQRKIISQQQKFQFLQQQSYHLPQLLYITFICLFIQIYLLIIRLSMLTIMCYLQSFFILLIGYIYASAVLYLQIQILASILLDIIFLLVFCQIILKQQEIYATLPINQILRYIFIGLMIVSMILRILLMWKWKNFIEITKKSYFFTLHGQKIKLNKRIVIIK